MTSTCTCCCNKHCCCLQDLKNPHVVQVHDYLDFGTDIFLVMEFCNGGDMHGYLYGNYCRHIHLYSHGSSLHSDHTGHVHTHTHTHTQTHTHTNTCTNTHAHAYALRCPESAGEFLQHCVCVCVCVCVSVVK